MNKLKTVLHWSLGLLSAYMVINGITLHVATSGVVQGSEFGMLITLANQMSSVMVWLALFAWCSLLPADLTGHKNHGDQ